MEMEYFDLNDDFPTKIFISSEKIQKTKCWNYLCELPKLKILKFGSLFIISLFFSILILINQLNIRRLFIDFGENSYYINHIKDLEFKVNQTEFIISNMSLQWNFNFNDLIEKNLSEFARNMKESQNYNLQYTKSIFHSFKTAILDKIMEHDGATDIEINTLFNSINQLSSQIEEIITSINHTQEIQNYSNVTFTLIQDKIRQIGKLSNDLKTLEIQFDNNTIITKEKLKTFFKLINNGLVSHDKCYEDFCYFLGDELLDLNKASHFCNSIGGFLPQIKNQNDFKLILKIMKQYSIETVNAGIHDVNSESNWKYMDDETDISFVKWCRGEPNNKGNEDCAEISKIGKCYNDLSCREKPRKFICSYVNLFK